MSFSSVMSINVLQAAAVHDTVVTRVLAQRDLFDWTSGILQIIVLLLGAGMLVALILLVLSLRAAVAKVNETIVRLTAETKPLIAQTTSIVTDMREVVAMVRTDAERLTDAAGLFSEQLVDAADVTSRRIGEVNAVIDVLQAELENTAIGTMSALRGVRVGAQTLSSGMRRPSRSRDARHRDGVERDAAHGDTSHRHTDDELDDIDAIALDEDDMDDIELDQERAPA